MRFWGIEVKSGQNVVIKPGLDTNLHLSQACLGEIKKDMQSEYVRLYVRKDGQKYVLGILSLEKFPQLSFDMVFEDVFELSHDGKHGSVHFAGYEAFAPDVDESESDEPDEEPVPVKALDSGEKPAAEDDNDSDEDDEDYSESEDDEDVEESLVDEDDSSDDEDETDKSEEALPIEVKTCKKRAAEASNTTPGPSKKAKLATPKKNDGKASVPHVDTPHPCKKAGKNPTTGDKSKPQTPRSSGSFPCGTCKRSFVSDQALQSHTKAKHAAN